MARPKSDFTYFFKKTGPAIWLIGWLGLVAITLGLWTVQFPILAQTKYLPDQLAANSIKAGQVEGFFKPELDQS